MDRSRAIARSGAPTTPGLIALARKARKLTRRGRYVFLRDYEVLEAHHRSCAANHRTYKKMLRCLLGRGLAWSEGEGPFAAITTCRDKATATLWPAEQTARGLLEQLDLGLCGPGCAGAHLLVKLVK